MLRFVIIFVKRCICLQNRLKELRNEKKLTTRELANIYGVSHASISRAENGERSLTESDIQFFTKFFGVSADYLLGLSDTRTYTQDITILDNNGKTVVKMELLKKLEDLQAEDIEEIFKYVDYLKHKGENNK